MKYLLIEHNGNGEIERSGVSIINLKNGSISDMAEDYDEYTQALVPLSWVEDVIKKNKVK